MVVSTKKAFFSFKNKLSNRFLQNLAWLGGSQVVNRVARFATTATIARLLSPTDYGLAAVVLTAHKFINVFTRGGIVTKLIQAPESDLEACNETAYWLNWILCRLLFVLQCAFAFPIREFYGNSAIALLVANLIAIPIFTLWTSRYLRRLRFASRLFSAL
jgi:PST family polysaccharide transporter